MASQRDFFDESSNDEKKVCSLPTHLYNWVILFQWDVPENSGRFKFFERNLFPEIKDAWIQGQLKANSRAKKLKPFQSEGGTFSLFGKIESGMFLLLNLIVFIIYIYIYHKCMHAFS